MSNINLTQHWSNVKPGWRHIVSSMSEEKKSRIINRVKKNMFDEVDWSNIKNVVEWGAGGGLLAKYVVDNYNVDIGILDISEDSLYECNKYVNSSRLKYIDKLYTDLSSFTWEWTNIDFLYCNEVIQHFPSIEYFEEVANIWKHSIKPTWLSFQVKLSSANKVCDDYSKDFLNGLLLTKEYCCKTFEDKYNLQHFGTEKTQYGQYLGYFTYVRK